MNLFGKQVSIAVLISFIVTLATTVGGTWVAIVNQWGKEDPSAWIVAALGALGVTISAAAHIWDTMPQNVTPPKP